MNAVHQANTLLFRGSVFEKIFSDTYANSERTTLVVKEPGYDPPYISNDPVSFNAVIMSYHYLSSVLSENDGATLVAQQKCNNLIRFLEQKFDSE